jgi:xylulokinase
MDAVIGIDIGTYSSKGVVCGADGSVLAEARVEHGVSIPGPGRMEHDADAVWWRDFVKISQQLVARLSPSVTIAAVGLSAIGPCLLPVDRAGQPLRPAILYGADIRATDQLVRLERGRKAAIARLSGNDMTSQAAGPKILWLIEQEPQIMRRTSKLLTAAGYLVLRLTGEYSTDHHNASYFAPFYDLRQARWDLRFADGAVPPELLPPLRWPSEVVGRVTKDAAAATGIPSGTPVLAGTTDGAAEAIGAGVIRPGDLMLSYGSTSALVLVLDRLQTAKPLWATRGSWPDEYVLAAALSTSGSITTWCREQFAREFPLDGPGDAGTAYERLSREAEASTLGARGLLLLPYFSGERSPFNDPDARGVIAGLSLSHRRGDVYRAILEGTAFGIRHNLEAMVASGTVPRRTVAVGGGTASRLWLQIVSDVTGLVQELPDRAIGAAYGDAYLAASTVGLLDGGAPSRSWIRILDRIEPDAQRQQRYEHRYGLYRTLYSSTRRVVHALAQEAAAASQPDADGASPRSDAAARPSA